MSNASTPQDSGNMEQLNLSLSSMQDHPSWELHEGRQLLLEALRLSEERYNTLLVNSGEAIFRVDLPEPVPVDADFKKQQEHILNGVILECNQPFLQWFGNVPEKTFVGKKFGQALADFTPVVEAFIQRGLRLLRYEYTFYPLQNVPVTQTARIEKTLTIEVSCSSVVQEGRLIRFWASAKDITESKRYLEMLSYQANHDYLTKLPNRDYFRRLVSDCLSQKAKRKELHQLQALLLFDLDKFKDINDTLGHTIGDRVLKNIAHRIVGCLVEGDILARLGGDEFAVFMPHCESRDQADAVAKLIESQIKQVIVMDGLQMAVGCSVGIALAPDHGNDAMSLLRCADIAMYESKTRQNGPEFYSEESDNHSTQRLSLVADLGIAVRHDQMVLHYQPKIDLCRKLVTGFEALVRWQHPEQGLIFPDKFIPVAEMTNLIKPLTRRVIEKALEQLSEWRDQGIVCDVAVNLSARNLMDPGLVPFIQASLERYQVPAQCLQVEITESSLMMDPERALKILAELTEMGLEIAIDDFGTGYSSLAYLKRMPVSALKIDRSFVFHMLNNEQDQIIVASTIHLAHNLGLHVVAEGVENPEVLERLREMGCDLAQGYHISRPVPVEKVIPWLEGCPYGVQGLAQRRSTPPAYKQA